MVIDKGRFSWWCSVFREEMRRVDRIAWTVLRSLFRDSSIETAQINRFKMQLGAGG
jgi:hypothetical protein